MSIQLLKKVTLIGELSKKTEVLASLQDIGHIHLMNIAVSKEKPSRTDSLINQNARLLSEKLKKAINYLDQSPLKRKQYHHVDGIDLQNLVEKILDNQQAKRDFSDLRDRLLERSKSLQPWGNFNFPSGESIEGYRLWFYILPHKYKKSLETIDFPWEIIHQDSNQSWLVIIAKDEPDEHILPVDRIHTGSKSLQEVKEKLLETELRLEDIEVERQSFTRYLDILNHYRDEAADSSGLALAEKHSLDLEKVFVVQGWYPQKQMKTLSHYCEHNAVALVSENVGEKDQPPTLMDNPEAIKGGELLVGFYQMPSYASWDPSLMLFLSFSLFFAMILSDAGYALVLGSLLAGFWLKMGKSDTGKLLRPLLTTIVSASLGWGVLVGSYFGFSPSEGSLLCHGHLLDVNDFDSMMALSIGCGIFHLFIANLVQIKLAWNSFRALLHFGWIVVLIGASLIATGGENTIESQVGKVIVVSGLILVFVSGSNRKIDSAKALLLRTLDGLQALTNITNIFGDVLSYLRLFALGLDLQRSSKRCV